MLQLTRSEPYGKWHVKLPIIADGIEGAKLSRISGIVQIPFGGNASGLYIEKKKLVPNIARIIQERKILFLFISLSIFLKLYRNN